MKCLASPADSDDFRDLGFEHVIETYNTQSIGFVDLRDDSPERIGGILGSHEEYISGTNAELNDFVASCLVLRDYRLATTGIPERGGVRQLASCLPAHMSEFPLFVDCPKNLERVDIRIDNYGGRADEYSELAVAWCRNSTPERLCAADLFATAPEKGTRPDDRPDSTADEPEAKRPRPNGS
jgi:hypothetical protein